VEDGLGLGSELSAAARTMFSVRTYDAVHQNRYTTTIDEAEGDIVHHAAELGTSIIVPGKAGLCVRSSQNSKKMNGFEVLGLTWTFNPTLFYNFTKLRNSCLPSFAIIVGQSESWVVLAHLFLPDASG